MSVFNQLKNIFRQSGQDSKRTMDRLESVSRLVKENTINKSKLPSYKGLENYTLIKKLGE